MAIFAFRFLLCWIFVCAVEAFGEKHSDYTLKESHPLPGGWSCVERAASHHALELQIGLRQGEFHKLEQVLYESVFTLKRYVS